MKYCYIINPVAGQRESVAKHITAIEDSFVKNGLPYEIAITEQAGHATEIAKRMIKENHRVRICAIGGDGTLNEVACGAIGCDNVEIACFPSGSGNDLIKNYGTRKDFYDISYIIDGVPIEIDVIKVNDRYCINLFCTGIDASVAHDIPKYRRLPLVGGAMAYNLSLMINFSKKLGNDITITMNGESRRINCLLLAIANGCVYGGGYYAAPEAVLDDGLLDVVSVKTISRWRMAKVIPIYKKGNHIQNGEVIPELRDIMTYNRATKINISAENKIVVNLDGESYKMNNMEISVIRKGLKFLLPRVVFEKLMYKTN